MRFRVWKRVIVLAVAAAASACDEKLSTVGGPTPNLAPTFTAIQREVFETTDVAGRVACVTCHTSTGRNPAGGLNLNRDAAYDQLVNVAARGKTGAVRVVPGDPENSYLVQKLLGTGGIAGRRMPLNGPPYLTDGQVLILKRWIETGAARN